MVATTTMPIATRILKVSGSITVCPFELLISRGGFYGVTGVYPCACAAGDVEQIRKALLLQQARSRARSIPAGANHRGAFVFLQGQWTKALIEIRKRRVECARHMTANVFRGASHV